MRFLSILFFLVSSGLALAQSPVGVWNCESISQQQLPNQPSSNLMSAITLQINAGGTVFAQGTEIVQFGQFPFQAEAQWAMSGNELHIRGVKQGGSAAAFFANSGMPVPPEATQFAFSTFVQSDNFMAWEAVQGNKQVGISRFANQCQRAQ